MDMKRYFFKARVAINFIITFILAILIGFLLTISTEDIINVIMLVLAVISELLNIVVLFFNCTEANLK